jgi:hypothetical protein
MCQRFRAAGAGRRAGFAGLLTVSLALTAAAPTRADFITAVTGQNRKTVGSFDGLVLQSTGTNAVVTEVESGTVSKTNQSPTHDGKADPAPTPTPVNVKSASGAAYALPGVGAVDDKFDPKTGAGQTHTYQSTSGDRQPDRVGRLRRLHRVRGRERPRVRGTGAG